jgi:hypothetical protein
MDVEFGTLCHLGTNSKNYVGEEISGRVAECTRPKS